MVGGTVKEDPDAFGTYFQLMPAHCARRQLTLQHQKQPAFAVASSLTFLRSPPSAPGDGVSGLSCPS